MKNILRSLLFILRLAELSLITVTMLILVMIFFGIKPYIIKTGSMEPVISIGSLCFVNCHATFENVHENDIIVFKTGDMFVTHRAVRIDEYGITTKGDANNTEDTAKVTDENFVGKIVFCVPWLGKKLFFLQTRKGKTICFIFLAVFLAAVYFENRLKKSCSEAEDEGNAYMSSYADDNDDTARH